MKLPSGVRGYWIIVAVLCLAAIIVSFAAPWFSATPLLPKILAAAICLGIGFLTPRAWALPLSIVLWLAGAFLFGSTFEHHKDAASSIEFVLGFLAIALGLFAILAELFSGRKTKPAKRPETGPRFELGPEVQRLRMKLGFPYYFFLTFGTEDEADRFWQHLNTLGTPPAAFYAIIGSWLSVDYGDAKLWFVAWLCRDRRDSNAISHWEVSSRRPETPAGSGYASPFSPLSVGFQLEKIAGSREWRPAGR